MGNIKPREPANQLPQTEASKNFIHQKEYNSTLIDLTVTPQNTVITNLGGYPMTVDYANQVLALSEESQGYNSGQTTPNQSYRLIKKLKLKLNSPMDYSQTGQNGQTNISGSARVYLPGLVPVAGDVFFADIGGGRLGRFEVRENPRALSWYDRPVYEFEYVLIGLATIEAFNQFKEKVVQELNYVEEFIVSGQNPILTDEQLNNYYDLLRTEDKLTSSWLHEMFSHDFGTLLVPGQLEPTYDPYVVECALSLSDWGKHPLVKKIRELNVDDRQTRDYNNIYQVLLDCDINSLSLCFKTASIVSTMKWQRNYALGTIRHSGIRKVVYPKQPNVGVDAHYRDGSSGDLDGLPITNPAPDTQEIESIKTIPSIGSSDTYVFQAGFYAQDSTGQTHLEKLAMDYLTSEALDVNLLIKIIGQMKTWSSVDRYYLTPVVVILIRAAVKEL